MVVDQAVVVVIFDQQVVVVVVVFDPVLVVVVFDPVLVEVVFDQVMVVRVFDQGVVEVVWNAEAVGLEDHPEVAAEVMAGPREGVVVELVSHQVVVGDRKSVV